MKSLITGVVAFKRLHYPLDMMLICGRVCIAAPLRLRDLEERMGQRNILVDHSTAHRRAIKLLPAPEDVLRRHRRLVTRNWRTDETWIEAKGEWNYLYRAVDIAGNTVDFLLRTKRDELAARRDFEKATDRNRIDDNRQDRGQSGHAARQQYRTRGALCEPSGKVSEQHCPTGPPSDQACDSAHPVAQETPKVGIVLGGIEMKHMIDSGPMKDARMLKPPTAR